MHDTQYALFQELDRRCVSGGLQDGECRESVRLKRASIELEQSRGNPLVVDVLAGRTTFVQEYDRFSHALRGVRRFLPLPHDAVRNERLRNLAAIVPNVRHFTRRSLFAIDNPLTAGIYGFMASLAVNLVMDFTMRSDADDGVETAADGAWSGGWFTFGLILIGVLIGALAMLRYRTRDAKQIHAREAAAYMDVNYELYARKDDRTWAEYIRQQGESAGSRIALAGQEGRA